MVACAQPGWPAVGSPSAHTKVKQGVGEHNLHLPEEVAQPKSA